MFTKKENGMTIIELTLTIGIITIGLLAVMSVIINSFTDTMPLSSKLTAGYLTQDAFEITRRIRDKNFNIAYSEMQDPGEDPRRWTKGLLTEEEHDDMEEVEVSVTYDEEEVGSDYDEPLRIDGNGLFSYQGAEGTPFRRKVILQRHEESNYFPDGEDAEYLKVEVVVTWEERGEEYEHRASTKLFNWYLREWEYE